MLGSILCRKLLSHPKFASRNVVGITKSTHRHDEIRNAVLPPSPSSGERREEHAAVSSRFRLSTMDEALSCKKRYKDVVFCAPPSGFDDYSGAISEVATSLWSGLGETKEEKGGGGREGGSFVFTSSGVVYGDGSGSIVNESSPTVESESGGSVGKDGEKNPRALRMRNAESAALSIGGCALRLAGLYSLDRGAHNYWLTKLGSSTMDGRVAGTVQGRGDGIVNLLHYDDAASAVLAALLSGPHVTSRRVFLISDGSPTTRRGICESASKHPRYSAFGMPSFTSDDEAGQMGGKGKVYDGRRSNEALKWMPTYPSFDEFMMLDSSSAVSSQSTQ